MNKIRFLTLSLLLGLSSAGTLLAQDHQPNPTIDNTERKQVIEALTKQLQANYVFPDVATRLSAALAAKLAKGDYAAITTANAFAEALTHDLKELGKDGHFRVGFDPDFHAPASHDAVAAKAEIEQVRQDVTSSGFGIQRVERLPGNVGYLEIRRFGPTEIVSAAYASAMVLLSGTDALILDLRRNGGGEPTSVAFLLSHFFAEGDERHLNDLYFRHDNITHQYWTSPSVSVHYAKPVYVLTSARTFSGGEECAYDFQTQKRATLVGETTGGGANPGDPVELAHGFAAFIPNGRAINPVTHTNWEHVGVKPDIAVPAAKAQQTAYVAILKALLAKATDPEERGALQHDLTNAEKGDSDPPNYSPPQ
ncbi:S41 family peptidase [Rhodanobacter umsongensis]|uniref:S41 family peptidase n=1 Tax=Rhodanobacter umsongensis TaxID=633153 RepID=A0ABW0JNU8_9GAMM